MLKGAVKICPALKKAKIIRSWANFVPFTYDGLPIIGTIEGVEGFIMAAGHAHAMSHAPAVAVQLADLILEGKEDELMLHADYKRLRHSS